MAEAASRRGVLAAVREAVARVIARVIAFVGARWRGIGAGTAWTAERGTITHDDGSAGGSRLESLPTEILARILGRLPVSDLVRLRAVSRRVCAVVEMLRADDRTHWFACGAADVRRVKQLAFTVSPAYGGTSRGYHRTIAMPCTCGAVLWSEDAVEPLIVYTDEDGTDERRARMLAARRSGSYPDRHEGRLHPPARWALLAPERAAAMEAAQRLAQVDLRLILPYGMSRWNGGPPPFAGCLPFFLYLPDAVIRPTTPTGLRRLVDALLGDRQTNEREATRTQAIMDALLETLASPARARAFYQPPRQLGYYGKKEEEREEADRRRTAGLAWDWLDAWCFPLLAAGQRDTRQADDEDYIYDSSGEDFYGNDQLALVCPCFGPDYELAASFRDASGWTAWRFEARRLAANWRISLQQGRGRAFRYRRLGDNESAPFNALDDAAVAVYLDANVVAVDDLYTWMHGHFALSSIVILSGRSDGTRMVFMVGLSPRGHLVGAVTSSSSWW